MNPISPEYNEMLYGPNAGQHRGALAGMSEEERGEATRNRTMELLMERAHAEEEIERLTKERDSILHQMMDERCLPGSATTSLAEILKRRALPPVEELRNKFSDFFDELIGSTDLDRVDPEENSVTKNPRIAEEAKQEVVDSLESDDDVRRFYFNLCTMPEMVRSWLATLRKDDLELVHETALAGGRLEYSLDSVMDRGIPYPLPGVCEFFIEGDDYVAVIPDEVLEAMEWLDWDELLQAAAQHLQLVRFFDAIANLRGVLPLADAIEEYFALFPEDKRDAQDIVDELMDAVENDESSACFLDTGDEFYLLQYLLSSERRKEFGEDPYSMEKCDEGERGKLVIWLLEEHERIKPRPVTREMLEDFSLFDWEEKLPAVLSMRDFLDHNVPDVRDDHLFADKVLEELFEEAMWGQPNEGVNRLFEILEANDFIPAKSQVQPILNLWTNMTNSLPNWPNNGWAPNELERKRPGKRVFFNPDGSVMRVGRNDPCPCGSGKKYKRCCGR